MPRLEVRCSKEEKTRWTEQAKAVGVPLSVLVREAMERLRTWTAIDRKAYAERTWELARISNSLDRIARWCSGNTAGRVETVRVLNALMMIQRELWRMSDAHHDTQTRQGICSEGHRLSAERD